MEIEPKDEAVKSRIAIRCAKSAILLSSLKPFPNQNLKTTSIINEEEEKEMMKKSIGGLKMELARERMKSKKIKLCGLMEVVLEVMLVLCIASLIFMIAIDSL